MLRTTRQFRVSVRQESPASNKKKVPSFLFGREATGSSGQSAEGFCTAAAIFERASMFAWCTGDPVSSSWSSGAGWHSFFSPAADCTVREPVERFCCFPRGGRLSRLPVFEGAGAFSSCAHAPRRKAAKESHLKCSSLSLQKRGKSHTRPSVPTEGKLPARSFSPFTLHCSGHPG